MAACGSSGWQLSTKTSRWCATPPLRSSVRWRVPVKPHQTDTAPPEDEVRIRVESQAHATAPITGTSTPASGSRPNSFD
eukprot:5443705-Prymnesium_polylepis.1